MDNFVYEYHSEGFFGYSETELFDYFSIAHLLPLIILAVGIFLVYRYRNALRNFKYEETLRSIVGALLIFNECSYYWRLLYVGSSKPTELNMLDKLPLQVCEWT